MLVEDQEVSLVFPSYNRLLSSETSKVETDIPSCIIDSLTNNKLPWTIDTLTIYIYIYIYITQQFLDI